MKVAEIKLDKADDGTDLLVIKPTLLTRILGKEIVVIDGTIEDLKQSNLKEGK